MEFLIIILELLFTALTFGLGLAAMYDGKLPESWSKRKRCGILVPYFTVLFAPGAVYLFFLASGATVSPFGMEPSYIPGYMAMLMSTPFALQTAKDKKILKACFYFLVALSLSWNPVAASVPLTLFVIFSALDLVGGDMPDHFSRV